MATVLHLTDTHIAVDAAYALKGVEVRGSLAKVLAHASRHQSTPELLLATGDLAQDGSEAAYRWLAETLEPAASRLAALAGNHDDPSHLAAVLPMPRQIQLDGWRIILLHTPVPEAEGGRLADSELAFLAQALAAPPMPTLIALHHPPLLLGSRWLDAIGLDNAGDFWRLVEHRHQVRAVLFGHAHQAFDAFRGTVRLLGTPSTCAQFLPYADDFALDTLPPGYRTLTLHADGNLETAVHYLPPA
jgi:3',5'-cyclic-AMP phosphodiesterase